MTWFVKAFLKASLTWLALGVSAGVAMAAHPVWTVYRLAHVHMLLLGFVTMMIYGVAYHVIPRFAGCPISSRRAAIVQWWMSNVGLACMAVGFGLRGAGVARGTVVLAVGGSLSAIGAYVFAFLIWRTLDGTAAMRVAVRRAGQAAAVPRAAP
jgi:cbb3-type cytochrome oxidase subunit 1